MDNERPVGLSRRERQIMDVIYRLGRATVEQVRQALPDPPSYSAVRALMGILQRKGHLRHVKDGTRFLYLPTVSRSRAGRSALRRAMETFYDGSAAEALAALLEACDIELSADQLDRLTEWIDHARKGRS